MNRRKFIKNSSLAATAPLVLNKVSISPFATKKMLTSFSCDHEDRALVIVFLMGGNDGINTIVPMDQYDSYRNYRPNIYIPENQIIGLDGTLAENQNIGLHPSLTALKQMYDDGDAHIIQSVGYPVADKSHFKSTDLWLSGGDGGGVNATIKSGQFGRFLDSAYPGIVANPSGRNPDPLGLQLGNSTVSLGFLTNDNQVASANLTDQDPQGLFSVVQDIGTLPHTSTPSSDYGSELDYIMRIERNTSIYAERISSVFTGGSNAVTYPDNYFANQLKTVARLISGGSRTKLFLLHVYGFDTHDNQIETAGSPNSGRHAELLNGVFGGIKAFNDDLEQLGIADKVITTTISEFGRKVIENNGLGTDHGTLAPMVVMGKSIEGGVTGTNLNLDVQDNQGAPDNSQLQHDYRQIFSSFYQDWLGQGDSVLSSTFGSVYDKINVVSSENTVEPACYGKMLPVVFVTFEAHKVAENVAHVEWVTASETNHSHFEVQRSDDGMNFTAIGRVNGKGNQQGKKHYEIFDQDPRDGFNYYRLKSVDLDGSFMYSNVVSVLFRKQNVDGFMVFPNPAFHEAFVSFDCKKETSAILRVYDIGGHQLLESRMSMTRGKHKRRLDITHLQSGIYSVIIADSYGEIARSQLIIAK